MYKVVLTFPSSTVFAFPFLISSFWCRQVFLTYCYLNQIHCFPLPQIFALSSKTTVYKVEQNNKTNQQNGLKIALFIKNYQISQIKLYVGADQLTFF